MSKAKTQDTRLSRRKALGILGLTALAGYAAPVVTNLSRAEAHHKPSRTRTRTRTHLEHSHTRTRSRSDLHKHPHK